MALVDNAIDIVVSSIQTQTAPIYDLYTQNLQSLSSFINTGFNIPYLNTPLNQSLYNVTAQFFSTLRTIKQLAFDETISTQIDQVNQLKLQSKGFVPNVTFSSNQLSKLQDLVPEIYKRKGTKQSIEQLIRYLFSLPNFEIREFNYSESQFLDTKTDLPFEYTNQVITIYSIPQVVSTSVIPNPGAYGSVVNVPFDLAILSQLDMGMEDSNLLALPSMIVYPSTSTTTIGWNPINVLYTTYLVYYDSVSTINTIVYSIKVIEQTIGTVVTLNDPLWLTQSDQVVYQNVRTPYYLPVITSTWSDTIYAESFLLYGIYASLVQRLSNQQVTPQFTLPIFNITASIDEIAFALVIIMNRIVAMNNQSVGQTTKSIIPQSYTVLNPQVVSMNLTYDTIYRIIKGSCNFTPQVLDILTEFTLQNLYSTQVSLNQVYSYLMLNLPTYPETLLYQYASIYHSLFSNFATSVATENMLYALTQIYFNIEQIDYDSYWSLVTNFYQSCYTPQTLNQLYSSLLEVNISNPYATALSVYNPILYQFATTYPLTYNTISQLLILIEQVMNSLTSTYPTLYPLSFTTSTTLSQIRSLINYLKPIYTRPISQIAFEELTIDSVFPSYAPMKDTRTNAEKVYLWSSTYIGKYVYNNGITIQKNQPWLTLYNADQRNAVLDSQVNYSTSYLIYPRIASTYNIQETELISQFQPLITIPNPNVDIPYTIESNYMPLNLPIANETETTIEYVPTWVRVPTSFAIQKVPSITNLISNLPQAIASIVNPFWARYTLTITNSGILPLASVYDSSFIDQEYQQAIPTLGSNLVENASYLLLELEPMLSSSTPSPMLISGPVLAEVINTTPATVQALIDWLDNKRTYYARYADDFIVIESKYYPYESSGQYVVEYISWTVET